MFEVIGKGSSQIAPPPHPPSRILSSLVTCLDCFIFLESEYQFTDALLALQADSTIADSADVELLVPYFKPLPPSPPTLWTPWHPHSPAESSSLMLAQWKEIVSLYHATSLGGGKRGFYHHTTSQRSLSLSLSAPQHRISVYHPVPSSSSSLSQVGEDYPWPLFSSYPAPSIYQLSHLPSSTAKSTYKHSSH